MGILECIFIFLCVVVPIIVGSFIGCLIGTVIDRTLNKKPKSNVHFYVARDPDGSLWLYVGKPFRKRDRFSTHIPDCWTRLNNKDTFKYFGLNQNDFDNLKWEDKPVEVFINVKD